jgi:Protein of unknown function (DUF1203)
MEPFASLLRMTDDELRAFGAKRYIADTKPGFPCRVSLEDAEPGEEVILTSFIHQPAEESPYRASGPVFVRRSARQATLPDNVVPEQLRVRVLSVRAYDAGSFMRKATVVDGKELGPVITDLLGDVQVSYLHVHFAAPGCYACRIDRV